MEHLPGPDSIKFRLFLQREFMLRDLDNEHDKNKEVAWVEKNAVRFSDYFDTVNKNGILERQYQRATDAEKEALIGSWLDAMRKDTKKAA